MTRRTISYVTHARATLVLGLPLVGSSIAQLMLHVVNTVMVGWYGAIPLAALVLGASLFFFLFIVGTGFAKAVLPLAAAAAATGNDTEMRRIGRMGLWHAIGYGILIYPLFWFSDDLFLLLRQNPDVARQAQDYLHVAGIGLAPALSIAVLQGWLAALGRTQFVLWVTIVAVVSGAVINWFLIFGNGGAPEMGVAGAGVSSAMVQVLSVVAIGIYAAILPDLRRYLLFRRFWRIDSAAFRQVFRLGWPISLTGMAESGLFEASAIMMGWVGTAQLAAHGIALEAVALAFMVHLGLSSAVTIRVAAFEGQGNARALRDAAMMGMMMSGLVAVVVIVMFLTLPRTIVGLFLDATRADSQEIMHYGVILLGMGALFQLTDALQAMALGMLRGLQDTRIPMILAAISYWVIGIPIGYILAFHAGHGAPGLWMGLTAGLAAAAISLTTRFWWLAPNPQSAR